ncbi:MAG: hypothetical protein CVV41_15050 [Candidatus Riflebacteria bacterium HGW-Riflebacteria-1]|nr:MAG: hypothetical protein CVV41_15050 [Candidatus Riflebacteria bacterium HGW-Riflebacteria-1]
MKTGTEKIQIAFRYAFGLLSPVIISLVIAFAALAFYNYLQQQDRDKKLQVLEERAELTLATVMSRLTFADQFTWYGNRLSSEVERHGPASFSAELLNARIEKHFPKGFIGKDSKTWAFLVNDKSVKALTGGMLESSRLRITEKLTTGLLEFANNPDLNLSQINQNEKLVKTILGPNSAPLHLGRTREGRLTPVVFEGNSYFIYWRQFRQANQVFAVMISFIPTTAVTDTNFALRHIATRMFNDSQNRLAVAFVPVLELADALPVVLPDQFDKDPTYREHIKSLLSGLKSNQAASTIASSTKKIYEFSDHLFMSDMTSIDVPYDTVVFAPVPGALQKTGSGITPVTTCTVGFWLLMFIYFYYKTGRAGLPLAVAFRILFVFSGMLPIVLMIALAHGLIEESHATSLAELRRENTEKLSRINERSDNLKQLFGYNISQAINEFELQRLLTTNSRQDAEKAYEIIRKHLEKMELALDYIYIFVPGGKSELVMHDQRRYQNAKTIMDLFGPATYKINQKYAKFSNTPEINLSASQKNFYNILDGFGNNFLEEVFMHSYEKEIAMKFGDKSADYFYTVAFSEKGLIKSYAGFAANSERLFRNFLARELDSLNASDSTIFLAAEELANSEFTIFPFKKMNALNSQIGRNAMNFITRCRSSLFEKYLTDRNHMYIFSPLIKQSSYASGCIVSLSEINRERDVKRLVLACISVLLVCLMYVMASFAAARMLVPLEAINRTLQAISSGNLQSSLNFVRNDEIGQLADSINKMLEGFKRRIRLGKFVSTTFEQSLATNSSLEESTKARKLMGSVLFSDIRNFTTLSESNPPELIASMLNCHLESMSAQVQKFGGQVEQFIGDAIVAFFPDQQPESSKANALAAAIAMHSAHQSLIRSRENAGQFTYAFGIGLEYGQIVAGPLITPSRSEFCIIGKARADAENFEQLSKMGQHTRIIVSAGFVDTASRCSCSCEPLAGTELFELAAGEIQP